MERNIGDQLNKAFEAYRQVSIEKDNVKKELQQKTEYYERYTQKLQKQIEEQQLLISELEAKLSAAQQHPEMKSEPCNHLLDDAYRKIQYLVLKVSNGKSTSECVNVQPVDVDLYGVYLHENDMEEIENRGTVAAAPNMQINSAIDCQDMLDAIEAIQGTFRQIQSLSRRQKDQLKRFRGGNETSSDQRFSMPIQCTDRTEEVERPFSAALRPAVDIQLPPSSLVSCGASSEDRGLVDSLTKLSLKFPPSVDSEYDFLNSTPEGNLGLTMATKRPLARVPGTLTEEESVELPMPFVYPTSPSHSSSSSLSQEVVRGPQQPLWSPELCDAVGMGTEASESQSNSPDKCAFCYAVVPQDRMNSHLFLHFSPKNDAHK